MVVPLVVAVLSLSPTEFVASKFFAWFKASDGVAALHQKHVESESVLHMIKGTPLAEAPDDAKVLLPAALSLPSVC